MSIKMIPAILRVNDDEVRRAYAAWHSYRATVLLVREEIKKVRVGILLTVNGDEKYGWMATQPFEHENDQTTIVFKYHPDEDNKPGQSKLLVVRYDAFLDSFDCEQAITLRTFIDDIDKHVYLATVRGLLLNE